MRVPQRVKDGLVQGAAQGLVLVAILYLAVAVVGNSEQEALNDIRDANQSFVAGVLCGLSAPAQQEERPGGEVVTSRPEAFVNRVCLENLAFDAVDLDGNGTIETIGGQGP